MHEISENIYVRKILQNCHGDREDLTGKEIEWDGINMKITNDDGANKLIREPYQNGWDI